MATLGRALLFAVSSATETAAGIMAKQSEIADLVAHDVTVAFGGLTALGNVSLRLERREILGLIGPNGAGKTTMVNCFTGFQEPSSGEIRVGELVTSAWSPERYRKAGICRTFQAGRLFREMTVLENVEVTAAGLGRSRQVSRRLALDILGYFGLADKAHIVAGTLPYTDERRVGIARALVVAPAFVLLDEPAAGMTNAECDELMRAISQIPGSFACGVLLVEHNMRVVMGVCDRIHVLDGGRTIAEGTPTEIQTNTAVINAYLGTGNIRPK
ncbi:MULTISPECIES: ABC transporter ATP-binding protein [unclassified Bradyrhizobium]|uniref:ABC transporter ATP-binding protein n=1 Tax=unclassified Bradyrhizobium TaxID=2631580 RepID=UPI00247A33B1|nr:MULTISPECIES: ABC transporter ATP-binding protein [unclassified Bradyrhizobium]WGS19198.1 ABC transporter ATP-binding protein [Bradyrhizobium sp. ISRA463]WGS26034.1 ABC transporter ATP-binding protein [Bradyrhizobium sp. ISRA464]